MSNEDFLEAFCDGVKEAYTKIYGVDKWEGLTDTQKHEAVMMIANDLLRFM